MFLPGQHDAVNLGIYPSLQLSLGPSVPIGMDERATGGTAAGPWLWAPRTLGAAHTKYMNADRRC